MASKDKNQDHPVFKNVVASKRTYAYALLQGKSVWNAEKGYSTRVAPTQIGSIKSKDGIGECVFNINFLSENPEFIPWKVIRVGQGKFEYERRSEAEIKEIKQKLADSQDILDDIKANPSKPGIRTKASVARNSGSATPRPAALLVSLAIIICSNPLWIRCHHLISLKRLCLMTNTSCWYT
ncbi:hypothetical protein [Anaerobiospirillum thomasii]|uniref:Uncharacterized protein n=1 Tax=Anaerobiospirillum thomasii TaxID=179995 RepID=A0A2X0WVV0_9GAMM|nr:hypothetical protein [Anaerobiospirillum thomasii]SPT70612.1 Uncharacterised protein [Anaerobiospirillum thomasii]